MCTKIDDIIRLISDVLALVYVQVVRGLHQSPAGVIWLAMPRRRSRSKGPVSHIQRIDGRCTADIDQWKGTSRLDLIPI